jgi:hypothetical protein
MSNTVKFEEFSTQKENIQKRKQGHKPQDLKEFAAGIDYEHERFQVTNYKENKSKIIKF